MLLCVRAAAAALLRRSHAACSSWLRLILLNALCVAGPLIDSLLLRLHTCRRCINQSFNIFDVLGGNWNPTDKKFSSVYSKETRFASYMQSIP